jgi:hypothetical protein
MPTEGFWEMNMNRVFPLLAFAFLTILPCSIIAQTGALSGYVTDSSQNPVELARVVVLGTTGAAIANPDGFYLIDELAPGTYDISVNRSEYHNSIISGVMVIADSTIALDIELGPPQKVEIAHSYMFSDELWIPVSINNNIPLSEFAFLIKWPSDYLILEAVNPTSRIDYGDFSYIIDDAGPGTVRILWDAGANSPMAGGSGPVFFFHFIADSSLYLCQILPVYFIGSQADNAAYDSSGNSVFLDNFFSGSVLKVEPNSYGCYDPDWNGWPLDIGDLIIVRDRIVLGYGVWRINPPLQETMADLNNNGFVDTADLIRFLYLIEGNIPPGNYPLLTFPTIMDPYIRDAFVLGNIDGSPVVGNPGQAVEMPVFIRTDEEIENFALRVMTDTAHISEILGVELTPFLEGWGIGLGPEFYYQPGFLGKTATAGVDSGGPLNTNGQWSDAIAHFTLRLADAGFNGGESIRLKAEVSLVDSNYIVYQPVIVEGSILVEIAECDYVFGDANSDSSFNGLDVIYSINYFKGQGPPPPTDCYCGIHGFYGSNADSNGDCHFNGVDVVYSVCALKGIGPMPLGCPDCP